MDKSHWPALGLGLAGLGQLSYAALMFTFGDVEMFFAAITGLGLLQAAAGLASSDAKAGPAMAAAGLALAGAASLPDFWNAARPFATAALFANLFEGAGFALAGAAGLLWAHDRARWEPRATHLLRAGLAVAALSGLAWLPLTGPALSPWLLPNLLATVGCAAAAWAIAPPGPEATQRRKAPQAPAAGGAHRRR